MNAEHEAWIVRAMSEAKFYDHPVAEVVLIETHISWVFLAGDFAYKVKKPLDFGFLDFSTLAKRLHAPRLPDLEPFEGEDVLEAALREFARTEKGAYGPPLPEVVGLLAKIGQEYKTRHLVALADEHAVIGHAATWRDGAQLHLINVACAAEATGRGVASRLLLDLFTGVETEALSLEVRPGNRRAQRLYGRFGFVPAGVTRGLTTGPTGRARAMHW